MNPSVDQSSTTGVVTDEKKLGCKNVRFDPGGGGINVSRAINIIGGKTKAFYPAGGCTGELLKKLLNREKIAHSTISVDQPTRINVHILEESTNKQYRFNMPGKSLRKREWIECLQTLEKISPSADYIVASGSLPPGVPDDFYKQVAKLSKKIGFKLLVDASADPLKRALEEGVYLIKPNLREFTELINEKMKDEKQIFKKGKQIIENNQCQIIVISMGASGTFVITDKEYKHHNSPIVPINSRIGAGDCMLAALTLKLAKQKDLDKAVKYGVAAGSAAVITPGTELCRKEDVERLYKNLI